MTLASLVLDSASVVGDSIEPVSEHYLSL